MDVDTLYRLSKEHFFTSSQKKPQGSSRNGYNEKAVDKVKKFEAEYNEHNNNDEVRRMNICFTDGKIKIVLIEDNYYIVITVGNATSRSSCKYEYYIELIVRY